MLCGQASLAALGQLWHCVVTLSPKPIPKANLLISRPGASVPGEPRTSHPAAQGWAQGSPFLSPLLVAGPPAVHSLALVISRMNAGTQASGREHSQ